MAPKWLADPDNFTSPSPRGPSYPYRRLQHWYHEPDSGTDSEESDQTRRTLTPPPRDTPTEAQQKIIEEIDDRVAYDGLKALGGRPSHPAYEGEESLGGRPSRPHGRSRSIIYEPGEYRDILAFWQDDPWEWNVFAKQLEKWQQFCRYGQRRRETGEKFQLYVGEMCEHWTSRPHGFCYPRWFTPEGPCFYRKEGIKHQDILATWFEYLYWRCALQDDGQGLLKELRPKYESATKLLLHKLKELRKLGKDLENGDENVLERLCGRDVGTIERFCEGDIEAIERVCGSISTSIIAQKMYERRKLEEEIEEKPSSYEKLDQHDKLWDCIAEFQHDTKEYRYLRVKVDRLQVLLAWTRTQVDNLITQKEKQMGIEKIDGSPVPIDEMEKEMEREKSATRSVQDLSTSDSPAGGSITIPAPSGDRRCHLMLLSTEVRQMIWQKCLPSGPTAHFFEVVERQRKAHMLHHWSPEFRTRASKEYPSGYIAIYTLLAACRDSRELVVDCYRRRQQRFYESNGLEWGDDEQSRWRKSFGNMFETFHWIPGDDLVMLCFPPRQVARLPDRDAVTFASGPSRHVGIFLDEAIYLISKWGSRDNAETREGSTAPLLSRPVVNDADHVQHRIPEVLDVLRRRGPQKSLLDVASTITAEWEPDLGGIRRTHVFVNGTFASGGGNWSHNAARLHYESIGPLGGRRVGRRGITESRSSWQLAPGFFERTIGGNEMNPIRGYDDLVRSERRGHPTLLERRAGDSAERSPFGTICQLATSLENGCESCGWPELEQHPAADEELEGSHEEVDDPVPRILGLSYERF